MAFGDNRCAGSMEFMRIVSGIAGFLFLIGSLVLLAVGVFVLRAVPGGALELGTLPIETPTAALTIGADEIDANLQRALDIPESPLAALSEADFDIPLQLRVRTRSKQPVFAGVAPSSRVDTYLKSVPHDSFVSVSDGGAVILARLQRVVDNRPIGGAWEVQLDADSAQANLAAAEQAIGTAAARSRIRPVAQAPMQAPGWEESTTAQPGKAGRLTWDLGSAILRQSLVIMNADGSPGVQASVTPVLRLGFIERFFSAVRWAGIIGIVIAVILLLFAFKPRKQRQDPMQPAMPMGSFEGTLSGSESSPRTPGPPPDMPRPPGS